MFARVLLYSLPLLLAACASDPPSVVEAPPSPNGEPVQMEFSLASGRYHCDAGAVVDVHRNAAEADMLHVGWRGKRFAMARNPSASGLPRYENVGDGLVWIDLPWKSFLLDHKTGKPLASDCRPA
ncbi:MAG: MliC family protein [Rhodocyclaceae bacterium]|nr:MliC family protein [Rhodocyclaceae bacterium]